MSTGRGSGMVYWFTGLSGAGKSTLGRLFYERLKARQPFVVFLDGDRLREIFGQDLGYAEEDRRVSAMRNARLCQLLSEQGLDVVCATISMFHEVRNWNRAHIPRYREVYITAPADVLKHRDTRGFYAPPAGGGAPLVAGVDVAVEEPDRPDLRIVNDGSRTPEAIVAEVFPRLAA